MEVDCSSLDLISWQAVKKSKSPFVYSILTFLAFILSYKLIFLCFGHFCDFFFIFQDNKRNLRQTPCHNHESTMYQQGQCPLKQGNIRRMI